MEEAAEFYDDFSSARMADRAHFLQEKLGGSC
jgi:hypothetical protein